jgi:hypothetical protein
VLFALAIAAGPQASAQQQKLKIFFVMIMNGENFT